MPEQEEKKKQSFVGGAAILGVAAVLTKIMGAIFRVPLANIIGDDGMGYYQTAYPIYIALLMVSSSGLPTAISRMIAEARAKENYKESRRIFKLSLYIMSGLGIITGALLAIFAKAICAYIKEPEAIYCMYSVVPSLVLCPIISCVRGYFQGQRNMIPTGASQVVEQIARVAVGFGLAMLLLKKGLPQAAAGATFGASAGSIAALAFILIIYFKKKPELDKLIDGEEKRGQIKTPRSSREILKDMLTIAIPITFGAMIMPIINSIDTMMVKSRLVDLGYSSDVARAMFGQLSGMATPIINLPDAATAAVTMSLVPIIAAANKSGDTETIKDNAQLSVRYAVLVGLPCVFGIAVLAKPIMLLLYPMQKEAAIGAAGCLVAYSAGIVFLAVHQALSGVLQGIGKQNLPVLNLLIGAGVKILATYVLCGIPSINVRGAAFGTVIAYLISASLNFIAVRRYADVRINVGLCFVKPLISAGMMGLIVFFCYRVCSASMGNTVSTLISIGVGVVVYIILVFATGSITIDDLRPVKKLSKLVHLLDKIRGKGHNKDEEENS